MHIEKNHKIGIFMVAGLLALFSVVGGLEAIIFVVEVAVLGVLAIFLYHLKTKGPLTFFLVKVPLNLLFNLFLTVLLLKSWAMREFKKDFEKLDNPSFQKTT